MAKKKLEFSNVELPEKFDEETEILPAPKAKAAKAGKVKPSDKQSDYENHAKFAKFKGAK